MVSQKFFRCLLLFVVNGAVLVSPVTPVAASNLSEGIRFYTGGRYSDSIVFFKKEIAEHPNSVTAHYYLANCLAEVHRNKEAMAEYGETLRMDPDGPASKFCMTALGNLAAILTGGASSVSTQPEQVAATVAPGKKDPVEQQETVFEKEAIEKVARINKEAADRVRALQAERDEQIQPYRYGKYGLVSQSSSTTEPIRAEYQKQIDAIQLNAKKAADAVNIEAKQRSIALEDAAIDLQKAGSSHGNSSVTLVPSATSLYTRSYKTQSAPTGNPVALIAAPRKAISQTNLPSTKDKN